MVTLSYGPWHYKVTCYDVRLQTGRRVAEGHVKQLQYHPFIHKNVWYIGSIVTLEMHAA